MLLTTPANARWRRRSLWIVLIIAVVYLWDAQHHQPHGGTPLGIAYGALGLVSIAVLMAFGMRKRSYASGRGTLEGWLHVHIYLGVLALVVILFHSGFRFHDLVAVSALALLVLVVLSGVVGSVLYTVLPPRLADVESNLTTREISDRINGLMESMGRIAGGKSQRFQEICSELVRAERPKPMAGWRLVWQWLPEKRTLSGADKVQSYLGSVDAAERADLSQLLVLAREMREFHNRLVHKQRYVNLMAAWLYLHLPLSFAMIVAILGHLVAFFHYW